jgi:hypothetical protein
MLIAMVLNPKKKKRTPISIIRNAFERCSWLSDRHVSVRKAAAGSRND